MQRRQFFFLLSGLCCSSLQGSETSDNKISEKIKLRYRFKEGEILRWNVLQTLKMKTSVSGVEEIVETRSRSVKIWKTIKIENNGNAVYEYSVSDIDMYQSQTSRDDASYNSRRDKQIPAAFINLEGKVGVPLAHIAVTPQGKTTKKPLLIYSGSAFEENRIIILLPSEPITVGDFWTQPLPKELPLPNRLVKKIKTQHRFELKRVRTGLATLKFTSSVLTPLQPQDEMKIIDSYAVGEMELDLDAGHFIRQQTTIDREVVGIQGNSDYINYQARVTECCCGKKTCEICSKSEHD